MLKQKCIVCGKVKATSAPEKKWICSGCRGKVDNMLGQNTVGLKKTCAKCRTLKKGECPFTSNEREKIVSCNKFEHKDAERNKRRWEKYDG